MTNNISASSRLAFLQSITEETDACLRHYFTKRTFSVTQKANTSPVTQADLEVEKIIRVAARREFSDIHIIGEEYGQETSQDHTIKSGLKLIIDPIDATANFIRGVPVFATLLAFEVGGQITEGLVSAPALHATWQAGLNQGAFYNNAPIRVSEITELSDACAFHGTLYGYEATGLPAGAQNLLASTKRQRGFGDFYAPMLVAMGSGECSFDTNLACWDMAPIQIIVEEAGGKFSDFSGNPTIYNQAMLCSNKHVHQACLGYLNG